MGKAVEESKGVPRNVALDLRGRIAAATGVRRYVITAAQNATPVHEAFFASLLTYCRNRDAQLLVIPYRYKNPTAIWSKRAEHDDWWAPELAPYLIDYRINLCDNLVLLGDIKTQPTASVPLQGFESITGKRSGIVGHPKLDLTPVPTPQSKLPKILTTTGAITRRNYIESKAGKKAEFHHTFAAAVVEIDSDTFHLRQLVSMDDGSFMDVSNVSGAGGTVEYSGATIRRNLPAEALVMGDTHEEFIDPNVERVTFGKDGIVARLRPKVLVWHDVHDAYARNHHHWGEVFINYAKHHAKKDNVERALAGTFAFVDRVSPSYAQNVFVASNHPEAIAKWVKTADPKLDPENAVFWAKTFVAMLAGSKWTDTGASTIDPFAYWGKKMLKCAARSRFLARDESYIIKGIELSFHGDKGSNGAKGSLKGFEKIGVKTVTGDSHTPGISGGAYKVGLSARYALEYAKGGPSSWLHTHCVIYANGKRSLINIMATGFTA